MDAERQIIGRKLSFIGAGNMAEALIKGILSAGVTTPANIIATDANPERLSWIRATYDIRTEAVNRRAVEQTEVVLVCVKPRMVPHVLQEIGAALQVDQMLISIAAGVAIAQLEAGLAAAVPVVRAMPNTPAVVQRGVTALAPGTHAETHHLRVAHELFRGVGMVAEVPETAMDAVTAVSGSGPAYAFFLMEAMCAAAVRHGLSEELATRMVIETVRGAGELAARAHEPPPVLRRQVTSPGGTTEAALNVLTACGVHDAFCAAITAAVERSHSLGRQL